MAMSRSRGHGSHHSANVCGIVSCLLRIYRHFFLCFLFLLRLEMMLRRMSDAGGSILRSQQLDGSERPQIWEQSLRLVTDKN